jgi:hypothetical protein
MMTNVVALRDGDAQRHAKPSRDCGMNVSLSVYFAALPNAAKLNTKGPTQSPNRSEKAPRGRMCGLHASEYNSATLAPNASLGQGCCHLDWQPGRTNIRKPARNPRFTEPG